MVWHRRGRGTSTREKQKKCGKAHQDGSGKGRSEGKQLYWSANDRMVEQRRKTGTKAQSEPRTRGIHFKTPRYIRVWGGFSNEKDERNEYTWVQYDNPQGTQTGNKTGISCVL